MTYPKKNYFSSVLISLKYVQFVQFVQNIYKSITYNWTLFYKIVQLCPKKCALKNVQFRVLGISYLKNLCQKKKVLFCQYSVTFRE